MAVGALGLAFGAVLKISGNHDLHIAFAPRNMIHRFIDNTI